MRVGLGLSNIMVRFLPVGMMSRCGIVLEVLELSKFIVLSRPVGRKCPKGRPKCPPSFGQDKFGKGMKTAVRQSWERMRKIQRSMSNAVRHKS